MVRTNCALLDACTEHFLNNLGQVRTLQVGSLSQRQLWDWAKP